MAAHILKLFILFQAICLCYPINTLTAVIEALQKLFNYYEKNIHHMNVDGFFGLRVMEGMLSVFNERLKELPEMDHYRNVQQLAASSAKLADKGLASIKNDDPEYFQSMFGLINRSWNFWGKDKYVNKSLKWNILVYSAGSNLNFDEDTSDTCMGQLIGTQASNNTKCVISRECMTLMTGRGLTNYGITHQILWSLVAVQHGCYKKLESALQKFTPYKSLSELLHVFCANNYYESLMLVEDYMKGDILPVFHDIFLEQQFVCPSVGFGAFIKRRYLYQILSWQQSNGCFGRYKRVSQQPPMTNFVKRFYPVMEHADDYDLGENDINEKDETVDEFDKGDDNVYDGVGVKDTNFRKLLVEKELSDGCLAHKSAVAAGALTVYLGYLLFPSKSHVAQNTPEDYLSANQIIPPSALIDKYEKLSDGPPDLPPRNKGKIDVAKDDDLDVANDVHDIDDDKVNKHFTDNGKKDKIVHGRNKGKDINNGPNEFADFDNIDNVNPKLLIKKFHEDISDPSLETHNMIHILLTIIGVLVLLLLLRFCCVRRIRLRYNLNVLTGIYHAFVKRR